MIAVNQYTWAMVFLSYYWEGDNVWKWLLLSHKRQEDHYVEILLIRSTVKIYDHSTHTQNKQLYIKKIFV